MKKTSTVDWHHTDDDPDPNLHVDADPDPDRHQNDADCHADPAPSFTHDGKSEYLFFYF
jgi:hypothetical protein